ncbi:MAG: SAM-dependent methyltransferase, partial [Bacteroidaceae bacterium]|nr:SAM-dependent methyltransferase [Bacteroidaceae bacterium]
MNEATWRFVRQHADDDVRMLALRGTKDSEVDMTDALQQIQGQQTARRKLPSWAACEGILFPPHLSMEQCSSEQTGRYKAEVVKSLYEAKGHSFLNKEGDGFLNNEGDTPYESPLKLVDLTGGFGVDFSFLAPLFSEAVYVERQKSLCALARHNFEVLGLRHAQVVCGTAEDFLGSLPNKADRAGGNLLIFLDPARRDEHGARTYGIADCTPDVLTLRDALLDKADYVMLKLSPMLDWRKTVSDLGTDCVREVHIVSVGGECKELLLVLSKEGEGMRLVCENDGKKWEPTPNPSQEEGGLEKVRTSLTPQTPLLLGGAGGGLLDGLLGRLLFLYEPNASVMKAGCFDALAAQF